MQAIICLSQRMTALGAGSGFIGYLMGASRAGNQIRHAAIVCVRQNPASPRPRGQNRCKAKLPSQNLTTSLTATAQRSATNCHNLPVGLGGDPAQQDPKRSLSGEARITARKCKSSSDGHALGEGRKQAAIGNILGDGVGGFERANPSRRRGPE